MSDGLPRGCLSSDDVLEFAQGRLPEADLLRVEAHVDACEACREVWLETLRALNTGRLGEKSRGSTVFEPGKLVGRFEILRFVARGAMGEVYEARDRELDVCVALKTVATLMCDSDRALRYLKEEVLLARSIAHPNVCKIYEWGTHSVTGSDFRVYFFTMEFVRGERLSTRLRRDGPFAVEQALAITRQLLSGLAAAHAAGILHRDFKSDNVILSEEKGQLRAVILDFGLARRVDRNSASSSFGPVGTRAYAAPEQLQGLTLRPSADVYAFGVVLFEMLTGRRPFEQSDGTEQAFACLSRMPVAPSRTRPGLPRRLDGFVLRCLSREPRGRFANAADALVVLDNLHPAGTPISERSNPAPRWSGLGPRSLFAASALMIAAYYGVVASTPKPERVEPPLSAQLLARIAGPGGDAHATETRAPSPPEATPALPAPTASQLAPKAPRKARPLLAKPAPSESASSAPSALSAASPRKARRWEPFDRPQSGAPAPVSSPAAPASGSVHASGENP